MPARRPIASAVLQAMTAALHLTMTALGAVVAGVVMTSCIGAIASAGL